MSTKRISNYAALAILAGALLAAPAAFAQAGGGSGGGGGGDGGGGESPTINQPATHAVPGKPKGNLTQAGCSVQSMGRVDGSPGECIAR